MTNKYYTLIGVAIWAALLASCTTHSSKGKSSFNLYSGVKVQEYKVEQWRNREITIQGESPGYLVTIKDYFPCGDEAPIPYLGITRGKNATLALNFTNSEAIFASSCEEQRTMKVTLENRVRSGDTIYILSNNTVLGHITAP